MPRFRKKPVVIEAHRLSTINRTQLVEWIGRAQANADGLVIETLEGEMQATWGDWIIRGVNGEHYPCKPDIFAKTYEEA